MPEIAPIGGSDLREESGRTKSMRDPGAAALGPDDAGWASITARNRSLMRARFAALTGGDSTPFWDGVADDVVWTVVGSAAGSGTFRSKSDFRENSVGPIRRRLADAGVPRLMGDVIADGNVVVLEWQRSARASSGMPYDHRVCWVLRLHDGLVTQATSYIDSKLVDELCRDATD